MDLEMDIVGKCNVLGRKVIIGEGYGFKRGFLSRK